MGYRPAGTNFPGASPRTVMKVLGHSRDRPSQLMYDTAVPILDGPTPDHPAPGGLIAAVAAAGLGVAHALQWVILLVSSGGTDLPPLPNVASQAALYDPSRAAVFRISLIFSQPALSFFFIPMP